MSALAAGQTWVSTMKTSFTDVPIDAERANAIATTQFLDAAESLTTIFGKPFTAVPSRCFATVTDSMINRGHVRRFQPCQERYPRKRQGSFPVNLSPSTSIRILTWLEL